MKATFIALICLLVLLPMMTACNPRPVERADASVPVVRVRLLSNVERADLTLDAAPVLVSDNGAKRRRLASGAGQTVVIKLDASGWKINSVDVGGDALVIEPAGVGTVKVNGIAYRGTFRLVPASAGRFDLVNDVDIESYLMGVLARELFPDWTVEAYRAQAIIARTYALYEAANVPAGRYWDLHPDERSQVYGGMKAETAKAIDAVNDTRGEVVVFGEPGREKIFKTYFSSCCGGVSADTADAFGETNIPPLTAQFRGNTCAISSRFNWPAITLTKTELTRRLKAWGARQGNAIAGAEQIKSIDIAALNPYGRPRQFMVTDTAGKTFTLLGEQLRWAINTDAQPGTTVFSSFFRPTDAGHSITLADGHGFGHGVGACQWCMQAKSLAGKTARQIVVESYPQSNVVTAY